MAITDVDKPFSGIKIDHLPADGSLGSVRIFSKGHVVWQRGSAQQSVFFLRRGMVHLVLTDDRNHETIVRRIRPGEPFGLSCLTARRRTTAPTSALAAVRSEVIEIPCDEFVAFLEKNQRAAIAALMTLSESVAFMEERLRVLFQHDAENRICALLEQLAEHGGSPRADAPGWRQIHLTHMELAELAGMSRAHVSVVMARLRKQGLIRYSRSTPLLIDVATIAQRGRAEASESEEDQHAAM